MSAAASKHSLERAKERQKLKNQRAAERNMDRALRNGKRAEDCSSWERNFLLHESHDDCVAVAYNGFCYIFNEQDVCVTLYPLPPWFEKKKRFVGKERIRDYKRYQSNFLDDYRRSGAAEMMDVCDDWMMGGNYMSRDWTPREHYLVEQQSIREGRGDYWDFLAGLEWVPVGRAPVRLHTDEEIALRQQFPVLGKFLEPFMALYERLSKYENGIATLQDIDRKLAEYIETGKGDEGVYFVRWFEGKLDGNFYYRERNDALLMALICETAMERSGKQYDAYMMYRADWMRENGLSLRWDGAKLHEEYLEDVKEGRFEGTFHQYEMEFGYTDVGTYDSFDVFLEKHYQEQVKDVDELIGYAVAKSEECNVSSVNKDAVDFTKE